MVQKSSVSSVLTFPIPRRTQNKPSEPVQKTSMSSHSQHKLFLLPTFFSPSTYPLSPRVHSCLSKVCGYLGWWEEELRNQKLQLWAVHGEAG